MQSQKIIRAADYEPVLKESAADPLEDIGDLGVNSCFVLKVEVQFIS